MPSRGPMPAGAMTTTNPTSQATAYAPTATGKSVGESAPKTRSTRVAWTPYASHMTSDQTSDMTVPVHVRVVSWAGRRRIRNATAMRRPSTGGVRQTSPTTISGMSHQNVANPVEEASRTATIPTTAAVTMLTSIDASAATALPVRCRPCARPSSAWAAMDQTPPGMYLPSCPTKKIEDAAARRTRNPLADIMARQESMFATRATIVAATPRTIVPASSRTKSRLMASHCRAMLQTRNARATTAATHLTTVSTRARRPVVGTAPIAASAEVSSGSGDPAADPVGCCASIDRQL
jgi:hypothetical protein